MSIPHELLYALKVRARSLVAGLEIAHRQVNARRVARRALVAHGTLRGLSLAERSAIVGELQQFVHDLGRGQDARTMDHGIRLQQLRLALEAMLAEGSATNLEAVGDSMNGIEFGKDDDSTDEEDHLELHCAELLRVLAKQLGPAVPGWLQRFAVDELAPCADDDEARGRD